MKALVLLGPSGSGKSWIAQQLLAAKAGSREIDPAKGAKLVISAAVQRYGAEWRWEHDRPWRTQPHAALGGQTPRAVLEAVANLAPETGLSWLEYELKQARLLQKPLVIIAARRFSEALAVWDVCRGQTKLWLLDTSGARQDAAWTGWWSPRDMAELESTNGVCWGIPARKVPDSRTIRSVNVMAMACQDRLL